MKPFALGFCARKVASLLDAPLARQAEARAHTRSDRREAFAADAPPVAQNGAAALLGFAIEKPVLPFAADFRWLILPFHVLIPISLTLKKPEVPHQGTARVTMARGV